MIVDVDVDITIVVGIAASAFSNNQNRSGLPAAAVTAGFVTGFERSIEFFGKLVVCVFESRAHCLNDMRPHQYVSLRRPRSAFLVTLPILSFAACENRNISFRIDNRDLAAAFSRKRIFVEQLIHHLLCRESLSQKL